MYLHFRSVPTYRELLYTLSENRMYYCKGVSPNPSKIIFHESLRLVLSISGISYVRYGRQPEPHLFNKSPEGPNQGPLGDTIFVIS